MMEKKSLVLAAGREPLGLGLGAVLDAAHAAARPAGLEEEKPSPASPEAPVEEDRRLQERERIAARGQVYKVRRANILKGKWVLHHTGALASAKTPGAVARLGERPDFRGHLYQVTEANGPGGRFVFRYVGRVPKPAESVQAASGDTGGQKG